ncbi:MAG: hypothetical protein QXO67_03915 [Candidatus Bathyarchaeia archaeon]
MSDPDVLDDYREFTVSLYVPPKPGYPKIVIVSVDAPSTVQAGQSFNVTVKWRNDGDAGTAWYRITDLDAGVEVLPRTEWTVAKGESGSKTVSMTMPNRSLRLRVEFGHVEA